MEVSDRFKKLLENLRLTDEQRADGIKKHSGVRSCLNSHYYSSSSETDNSFLVGSWGKETRIRPPRDIDVMFVLPSSVYYRYELAGGNRQSQLLQEVKNVLARTYASTNMRADGQVVMVNFATYNVEVVPAFNFSGSTQFRICDTNGGGRYKTVDPVAEVVALDNSNKITGGNTKNFVRMLKCWQGYCNVFELKSFWLELLATEFLATWPSRNCSMVLYDWMCRDFFTWLANKGANSSGYVMVPGTYETIWIGNDWASKAESAKIRAEKACISESKKLPCAAGEEWQKIFGSYIPQC